MAVPARDDGPVRDRRDTRAAAEDPRDPALLHPVGIDGRHAADRRQGTGQQVRVSPAADPPRRHRRLQRHRILGPAGQARPGQPQPGTPQLRRHAGLAVPVCPQPVRDHARPGRLHQARHRAPRGSRAVLHRRRPGHRQRRPAARVVLPGPGHAAVAVPLRHRRPARAAVGHGRQQAVLRRLAPAPVRVPRSRDHVRGLRPGRHDPREGRGRPGVPGHVAAQPVQGAADPADLRPARDAASRRLWPGHGQLRPWCGRPVRRHRHPAVRELPAARRGFRLRPPADRAPRQNTAPGQGRPPAAEVTPR